MEATPDKYINIFNVSCVGEMKIIFVIMQYVDMCL